MIVALLLLPLLAARAQEFLMVTDSAHLQHYIDSITRHYYGDFFALGGNVPVMPLYGNNNQYRTPIGEIHTADDTIDCVVEIFYGSSDKRTYKNIKGRALLEVRDRTFPMKIPLQRHYAHKDLKGRRKRYRFKLVSYIRCAPPQYPRREIKKVVAKVDYDALMPFNTEISYSVKHLPFSTKAKYGPYTPRDEHKARLRRKREEERSRAFGESMNAHRKYAIDKWVRKKNAKAAKAASETEAASQKGTMR